MSRTAILVLLFTGCAAPTWLAGGRPLVMAEALDAHRTYVAISENGKLLGEAGPRPDSLQEVHRFPSLTVVMVTDGVVAEATPELLAPDSPTAAILRVWMQFPKTTILEEASAELEGDGALVLVRQRASECRGNGDAVELIYRVLFFVSRSNVEARGKTLVDEQVIARGCHDRSR